MHIRFTEQELATLVEMLSLAVSVASWNQKPSADQKISEYEEFESKVLSAEERRLELEFRLFCDIEACNHRLPGRRFHQAEDHSQCRRL